ncbi:GNAT family N-acetyltransferase [Kordiimonas marina]|uniref:GNAT family N-acetyltransferase n=1 Tax=Kordiimonas marina TaxID=2872312 RepID=UPI001FF182D1|nr:GNAT family N-acetyltransferase [Kordiimonas marina]MCJ9428527.1 GNAT family N-acetyltransferase [Kordiimonas marina]
MTLELKPITDDELEAFWDHLNDPTIAVMAGTVPHPVTLKWTAERVARRRAEEAEGKAAQRGLYEDGVLVGDVSYFTGEDGDKEIGYAINRAHRGRGLATIAARLAVDLLRDHGHTGPIYAGYAKDNPASGRVLEKVGFTRCGEGLVPSMGREEAMPLWRVVYTEPEQA